MSLNFEPDTIFHMDNLDALRGMNSATIDLIATDPPFNTGRNRESVGGKYVDQWRWGENVHPIWLDQIRDDNRALAEVIESGIHAHSPNLGAFLCFLGVRLLEMKRVLKDTGSIYLHCDPTASHYIKAIMDAVFGASNFRNEIVWIRSNPKNDASKKYGSVSDRIYYYIINKAIWNGSYIPLEEEYVKKAYRKRDIRGLFMLGPLFVSPNQSGSGYKYDYKGHIRIWRYPKEAMDLLEKDNRIYVPEKEGALPYRKIYLESNKGKPNGDVWTDIKPPSQKERVGYPDQKPVALYERIIKASSNEGDLVLDPFAGCGTTIMAAKNLNRHWVGVDRSDDARDMILCNLAGMKKDELREIYNKDPNFVKQLLNKHKARFIKEVPVRMDEGSETSIDSPTLVFAAKERSIFSHAEMRQILFDQFGPQCWGCDFVVPDNERGIQYFELDHINPKSGGGSGHLDNKSNLCGPCNKSKGADLSLIGLRKKVLGNKAAKEHPINLTLAGQWCREYLRNSIEKE